MTGDAVANAESLCDEGYHGSMEDAAGTVTE